MKTKIKTTKPVEITLTSFANMANAERCKAAIDSFRRDIYVNCCPYNGMVLVNVGTLAKGATKAKLTEEVMALLAFHSGRLLQP